MRLTSDVMSLIIADETIQGIMDTMNSTLAHGKATKLPKEFYDTKGRQIVDKLGVEEWCVSPSCSTSCTPG